MNMYRLSQSLKTIMQHYVPIMQESNVKGDLNLQKQFQKINMFRLISQLPLCPFHRILSDIPNKQNK